MPTVCGSLAPKISERGVVKYPVEPFAQWLDRLVEDAKREFPYRPTYGNQHRINDETALPPVTRVAYRCGVWPETIEKLRKRKVKWVDERLVDAMVSLEGSVHIGDLYSTYRTRPVAKPKPGRSASVRELVKPPDQRMTAIRP